MRQTPISRILGAATLTFSLFACGLPAKKETEDKREGPKTAKVEKKHEGRTPAEGKGLLGLEIDGSDAAALALRSLPESDEWIRVVVTRLDNMCSYPEPMPWPEPMPIGEPDYDYDDDEMIDRPTGLGTEEDLKKALEGCDEDGCDAVDGGGEDVIDEDFEDREEYEDEGYSDYGYEGEEYPYYCEADDLYIEEPLFGKWRGEYDFAPGQYHVQVEILNTRWDVIESGSEIVDIVNGRTTTARIQLVAHENGGLKVKVIRAKK